jgi:hypothetical protein
LKKELIGLLGILTVVVLAFGVFTALAQAQYYGGKTADFTIGQNGKVNIPQSQTQGNIDIEIYGKPGATGTVSTVQYSADPQPDASKPSNVKLGHFVVITFNMDPTDFVNATIKINFSADDIKGINRPFVLYKYIPETNSYVALDATIDENALTATVVLTSTTDPLFAIGGPIASTPTPTATTQPETAISLSTWAWIFVAIEAITGFILIIGVFQAQRSVKAKKQGN